MTNRESFARYIAGKSNGVAAVAKVKCLRRQSNQKMKFAWPEKAATGVALFIFATMLLVWALLADGAGTIHDIRLNVAAVNCFVGSELVFILPFWFFLRSIDHIFNNWHHGHSRRRTTRVVGHSRTLQCGESNESK